MDDPAWVERLWLVLAVATVWVVALGIEDEAQQRLQEELQKLHRDLSESEQQAQARQEREQQRLEKQRQALQARQERLAKRQQAKQQAAAKKVGAKKAKATAPQGTARQRTHRVSLRGLAVLKAAWERGQSPLPQQLYPESWPPPTHAASTLTEQEFLSQSK